MICFTKSPTRKMGFLTKIWFNFRTSCEHELRNIKPNSIQRVQIMCVRENTYIIFV
ncbi:hypothetical protein HanIR_Chr03g0128311 [Helianthus annuus]|nr:hypothetical protein HanIR_Chr03g0128311 [Helianthus annuus]